MKPFYICYCGNTSDPHNFRHPYTETTCVERCGSTFILDASKYPKKQGDKCSVPNCSALKSLHQTKVLDHEYKAEKFEYREIRLCVPENTVCKKCSLTLKEHFEIKEKDKAMTHPFCIGLQIKNKEESDKIFVFDKEDEDRKIVVID